MRGKKRKACKFCLQLSKLSVPYVKKKTMLLYILTVQADILAVNIDINFYRYL